MNQRRTTVACVACGLLCAVCVLAYGATVNEEAEEARSEALARYGGEQVEVCVASRDIAPGDTVTAADVGMKLWVADLLPEGAVKKLDEAIGKTASSSILAGEVVLEQRFGDDGSLLDVPSGKTAISVPAKNVQAVGGAIRAGMSVDVYATGNTSTARIAEGVAVLATSTTSASETSTAAKSEVAWVTLAVDPSLVEQMVAAAQQSQLYLTLPSEDVKGQDTKGSKQ